MHNEVPSNALAWETYFVFLQNFIRNFYFWCAILRRIYIYLATFIDQNLYIRKYGNFFTHFLKIIQIYKGKIGIIQHTYSIVGEYNVRKPYKKEKNKATREQ